MMRSMNRLFVAVGVWLLAVTPLTAAEVVRLRVDDTIQPASQRFIERGLEEAADVGAALVVIELDTPGGLVDTTRQITTAITTSRVPVAVLVTPGGAHAASAGFFILISADIAAMSPGTNTGAAQPVGGQGETLGDDIRAKATNDAAAMVRSLAEQRGRNVDLAIKAVTESVSYTAEEALENGLIDLVVPDLKGLLEALEGREVRRFDGSLTTLSLTAAPVTEVEPTFLERLLSVLANPNIAYLLLGLGALGLYVEITHPGGIFPGVVGAIFLLLGLYSLSVLPVSWAGVALIFVALVMFLLEVKVTSYGMLTVGGLIAFVLGSMMLFDGPVPAMRVSLGVVLPTALLVALVTVALLSRVIRAHRRPAMTGSEGLIGEVGQALSALAPAGKVAVHGEYWDARTTGEEVAAGAEVAVVAIEGRRLLVAPVATLDQTREGS